MLVHSSVVAKNTNKPVSKQAVTMHFMNTSKAHIHVKLYFKQQYIYPDYQTALTKILPDHKNFCHLGFSYLDFKLF